MRKYSLDTFFIQNLDAYLTVKKLSQKDKYMKEETLFDHGQEEKNIIRKKFEKKDKSPKPDCPYLEKYILELENKVFLLENQTQQQETELLAHQNCQTKYDAISLDCEKYKLLSQKRLIPELVDLIDGNSTEEIQKKFNQACQIQNKLTEKNQSEDLWDNEKYLSDKNKLFNFVKKIKEPV